MGTKKDSGLVDFETLRKAANIVGRAYDRQKQGDNEQRLARKLREKIKAAEQRVVE